MSYTNLIKETFGIIHLNITINENCLKRNESKEVSVRYSQVRSIIQLTFVFIENWKIKHRLIVKAIPLE